MININSQSIPQPSLTYHHWHRSWSILLLVVLVILIGVVYWFIETRHAHIVPPKTPAELRTEVAAMLQSSQPASAAKISAVSSLLSNSKATSSAEKRQNIANILNGK